MKHTFEILEKLGVDENLIKLAKKETAIPYIADDFNSPLDYWYQHPPALVPIFLGFGAAYYGYLKHWFVEREETYMRFVAEWGFMLEYARNSRQFFAQMILGMDMIKEGLDDKILKFAEAVDFKNPQKIDEFAEQYGDDKMNFDKLEFFSGDVPLTYLKSLDEYKGDFPSSEILFNASVIDKACSYEIAKDEYLDENSPEWLDKNTDKKTLFARYISENELGKAWLTLNSTGWRLADVADGLNELKTKTDDALFQMIADNWIDGWQNSNSREASY